MPNNNVVINHILEFYKNVNDKKDKITYYYNRKVDFVFTDDNLYKENNEIIILDNIRFSDHFPILYNISNIF